MIIFFIALYPHGEVCIHIVKPGFERIRVGHMPVKPRGNDRAAGGIMPALIAIRIRNTACHITIP
jgi:hypothetical protein